MKNALIPSVSIFLLLVQLFPLPPLPAQDRPAQDRPTQDRPTQDGAKSAVFTYEVVDAFPAQAKFDRPVLFDHDAADPDVYYVGEQCGKVFRIPRDGEKGDRHLFLDWTAKTFSPKSGGHNEEGLLGFAFDPKFAENGRVFIYYSRKTGERTFRRRGKEHTIATRESVISRLSSKKDESGRRVADPDSEHVVMRVPQPWGNHNGGTIVFGPDGMLYIVLGDGGAANDPRGNAQNLGTLLGSVLRIDVRNSRVKKPYAIPADNPFVDKLGARGEIFCYGLRNLWRISFDRENGDLWGADVGQDIWEEVDRLVKGGNYGWNKMEGTHPFPPSAEPVTEGMIAPVAQYHHREGISITGGYVYRGKTMPELRGQYIYADYQTGRLWAVAEDREHGKHKVTQLVRRAGAVASFGEGPDGEIFILRYDGHRISRLTRGG